MKAHGGEDCLMEKEFIKKLMVFILSYSLGDFYTGNFKNGLKHNEGMEYFGNGDLYKG